MRPTPRRFPILRPPPLRLVLVALLSLLVGLGVHRTTSAAAEVRATLGETTLVAVARRTLAPGDEIDGGAVALVERPTAHVPHGAVLTLPTGRVVRSSVAEGEIVVTTRLSGSDRRGPAGLIPEGWRGLAIPIIDAPLPANPGDVVDVIASFDPSLVERDPSVVVAADAVVVEVGDDAITVAVPRSRLTQVAFALSNGIVTLALVG